MYKLGINLESSVNMSSRTGQRNASVATRERRYRSKSSTGHGEKKPKKKDIPTSGTTSLVSIPNNIKLVMLNSGLISFGKWDYYNIFINFIKNII